MSHTTPSSECPTTPSSECPMTPSIECPTTPSTSEKYRKHDNKHLRNKIVQKDSQDPLRLGKMTSIVTPSIPTQSLARNVLSCIIDNPRKPRSWISSIYSQADSRCSVRARGQENLLIYLSLYGKSLMHVQTHETQLHILHQATQYKQMLAN
jgi:hypothetical protein